MLLKFMLVDCKNDYLLIKLRVSRKDGVHQRSCAEAGVDPRLDCHCWKWLHWS